MGSNQQTPKLPKGKAVWSYDLHKSFIDLCMEQVDANEKKGYFFSKNGWNKICTEFNKKNGKEYEKKQMKNHWENTKADWKICYKLKDFETGLRWDYGRNIIIASDEWWKDYIQKCPDAHKFPSQGIEFADQLTNLFLEGMATGKSAWAPSEKSLPNDSAGPCKDVENNGNESFVDLDLDTQNADPFIDINDDNDTIKKDSLLRKRKGKIDSIPPPEPRRRTSSGSAMINEMGRLSDICEEMVKRRSKPTVTVEDCIKILDEMEDEVPNESDLYLFACDLFLKQEYRDMFNALKPSIRLR